VSGKFYDNFIAHPTHLTSLPGDYFLFSKIKFVFKGRHFQSTTKLQVAVTRQLKGIPKEAS
jgi:hypothetical protein